MWIRLATLLVIGTAAPAVERQSTEAAKTAISNAASRALQGNAADGAILLAKVPEAEFGDKDKVVRNCIINRFSAQSTAPEVGAPTTITERTIGLYQGYWRSALMQPDATANAERKLEADLRNLLQLSHGAGWDEIERSLQEAIEAEGFHPLMGRTPPLLEMIVWKSETEEIRQVRLPEGEHRVVVKLLDQFESLGWSAYATCDRSFTGGWVSNDAIYAVRPGWKDLADENFAVSFVAHETQHFADKQRFGELESWELEYRAKLAELALADKTLPKLVKAFHANQGPDPAVPHSYANSLVISCLRAKLAVPASADLAATDARNVNQTATSLLLEDSLRRRRNAE